MTDLWHRIRLSLMILTVIPMWLLLAWNLIMRARRLSLVRKRPEPDLVAAITLAVLKHREVLRTQAPVVFRPLQPEELDPWVVEGRSRQHQNWHPDPRR
ncbi:MAG: hypothetical protein HC884_07685 [Chloroflexaceae bacterium]|nr:hypothetical protein [Chloroflexaceae bacterium]